MNLFKYENYRSFKKKRKENFLVLIEQKLLIFRSFSDYRKSSNYFELINIVSQAYQQFKICEKSTNNHFNVKDMIVSLDLN